MDKLVHYLDDFFTCGAAADSDECARNLQTIIDSFQQLGVPLAMDKLIGPVSILVYLGIEINTIDQIIRLPEAKFRELLSELTFWQQRKKCTKRDLLSLIGKLSFAAKVVRSGRIFLRRLIDLSTTVNNLHHHISLNADARADIAWWCDFLPTWNAKSMIPEPAWVTSADLKLSTDASSTIGFGVVYGTHWVYGEWPVEFDSPEFSIQWKELFPIYLACYIWGHEWAGKKILFLTDNEAITFIWQRQTSKCKKLMNLVRKIFFIAAEYDFILSLKHISGHYNILADLLSRLQVQKFLDLHPMADKNPTPVPQDAWRI